MGAQKGMFTLVSLGAQKWMFLVSLSSAKPTLQLTQYPLVQIF